MNAEGQAGGKAPGIESSGNFSALAGGADGRRPVLVWFRRDLRLADNPAWNAAASTGRPVIPVFILDERTRPMGAASRWWLYGSLRELNGALRRAGSRLILRRGPPCRVIDELARETGAAAVLWNRLYDPALMEVDRRVEAQCAAADIESQTFNASLLFEPWDIRTGAGTPFKVFTAFWRRCVLEDFEHPGSAPPLPAPPETWPVSDGLHRWGLRSRSPDWAEGFGSVWQPGERGAKDRLEKFLRYGVDGYHRQRDLPGLAATSRLSPHLHFGDIGPRQIVAALDGRDPGPGRDAFVRELGWREFSHHLLDHHPDMGTANLRPQFDRMPWRNEPDELRRWQRGLTGYPLVDAGMRELWSTGWLHNRVRMVTASFLTKHLLIDWRLGAAWYWDTLVDADWANNSAGWQWVAGCGVDAAPWFRVFNPVTQSRRFDPAGGYLRTWLPELRRLPDKFIHAPWHAADKVLIDAGIRLGESYPYPMVDLDSGRKRALDAYRTRVRSDARRKVR